VSGHFRQRALSGRPVGCSASPAKNVPERARTRPRRHRLGSRDEAGQAPLEDTERGFETTLSGHGCTKWSEYVASARTLAGESAVRTGEIFVTGDGTHRLTRANGMQPGGKWRTESLRGSPCG